MSYGKTHIQHIVTALSATDEIHLREQMTQIIEENCKLGNPSDGFLFYGEFCTTLPRSQQAQAEKKLLHPELHKQGRAYFNERNTCRQELHRISQGLFVVLDHCETDQDVRDTLPDLAIPVLPPDIASLPRTREPGYEFKSNPIKWYDFEHICGLIGFYVANKLLN